MRRDLCRSAPAPQELARAERTRVDEDGKGAVNPCRKARPVGWMNSARPAQSISLQEESSS